ncbi:hypothetical protein FRC19_003631 [Serendipita sp. 401]|nr:hypothetical protein FRC19_003631 [Serendipita sp. 401]
MNYSQSQVFWALHLSFSREFSVGVQFLQFDNVVSDLNAINYALDPKDKGENLQGSGVDEVNPHGWPAWQAYFSVLPCMFP